MLYPMVLDVKHSTKLEQGRFRVKGQVVFKNNILLSTFLLLAIIQEACQRYSVVLWTSKYPKYFYVFPINMFIAALNALLLLWEFMRWLLVVFVLLFLRGLSSTIWVKQERTLFTPPFPWFTLMSMETFFIKTLMMTGSHILLRACNDFSTLLVISWTCLLAVIFSNMKVVIFYNYWRALCELMFIYKGKPATISTAYPYVGLKFVGSDHNHKCDRYS